MSLLLPLIDAFNQHNISYVVVGGLAVVLHGHNRLTADIDLVIRLDSDNASKAVSIITEQGYAARAPVNPLDFADPSKREEWIQAKNLVVFSFYHKSNPLMAIDLFVDYPIDYEELYARSVCKKLGHIEVRICSIDDLISMKKKANRPKDTEDVRLLEIIKDAQS